MYLGLIADSWGRFIYPVACLASDDGIVVAQGVVPTCNHFVHSSGPDTGVVDVENDVVELLLSSQLLEATATSRGVFASFYEALGRSVTFTVAQGDCGPDVVAIDRGMPSTKHSWKMIRREVVAAMLELRDAEWFRDAFQASQEYAPDICISVDDSDDAVVVIDGGPEDAGTKANLDPEGPPVALRPEPGSVQQAEEAMHWALGGVCPGGKEHGAEEAEIPHDVVQAHLGRLDKSQVLELVEAHAGRSLLPSRKRRQGQTLQKNKSTLLSVRHSIDQSYAEFLEGLDLISSNTYTNVFPHICVLSETVWCSICFSSLQPPTRTLTIVFTVQCRVQYVIQTCVRLGQADSLLFSDYKTLGPIDNDSEF